MSDPPQTGNVAPVLTEGEIDTIIGQYKHAMTRYEEAAITVEGRLRRELRAAGKIRALLSSRAKHPDEVRAKLRDKRDEGKAPSFADLATNLNSCVTDLAGVRVVVYHPGDELRVFDLVQRKLEVWDGPNAVEEHHGPSKGYRARHLLIAVDSSFDRQSIRGTIVEVQIVSIANHVFNELEHDIIYKPHDVPPNDEVKALVEELLHASRLLDRVVERLLDERAASVTEAETELPSGEELRFTLERIVGRPLTGDFARLFSLLATSLDTVTPAALKDLAGGPEAVITAGQARANKNGIDCREDVTAYALGLCDLVMELRYGFHAVASGWRGPHTELKRAILDIKGEPPE